MTDQPSKIEIRFPDGGLSLGAATDELAVRRFRRPDGQIEPEVGGDGLVHISASLSEGQLVEKIVDRGATKRIIAAGDVSIDRLALRRPRGIGHHPDVAGSRRHRRAGSGVHRTPPA